MKNIFVCVQTSVAEQKIKFSGEGRRKRINSNAGKTKQDDKRV